MIEMTDEIRDARELVDVLKGTAAPANPPIWAWWAPGDMTRYKVGLIRMYPQDRVSTLGSVDLLIVMTHAQTITIDRPLVPSRNWTAERFLRSHGEAYAGWWAGVRPILAALGWTPIGERNTAYNPHAATQIGELMQARR